MLPTKAFCGNHACGREVLASNLATRTRARSMAGFFHNAQYPNMSGELADRRYATARSIDHTAYHRLPPLAQIADALNARGIQSASGGRWHRSAVRNLLVRANSCEA